MGEQESIIDLKNHSNIFNEIHIMRQLCLLVY